MALFLVLLPMLLFGLVGLLINGLLLYVAFRVIKKLAQWAYGKISNKSHIFSSALTLDEMRSRVRDADNSQKGYNPISQDFTAQEMFPPQVDVGKLWRAYKALFVSSHFIKQDIFNKSPSIQNVYLFFYGLLMERECRITSGDWTQEDEKNWLAFPYLPKQMQKLDKDYFIFVSKEVNSKDFVIC